MCKANVKNVSLVTKKKPVEIARVKQEFFIGI